MSRATHHVPSIRHAFAGLVACALTLTAVPVANAVDPSTCESVTADWDFSAQPIEISSANALYCIGEGGIRPDGDGNATENTLEADYVLTGDIDLATRTIGTAWRPIGSSSGPFTGVLDGNGKSITNLSVAGGGSDGPGDGVERVGLFGRISDAEILNVTLVSPSIEGGSFVGSLVGESTASDISAVTATTVSVTADLDFARVGGLIGSMTHTRVADVSVTGSISALSDMTEDAGGVGGVIGRIDDTPVSGGAVAPVTTVQNATFSGDVSGPAVMGGVIGHADTDPTNGEKWLSLSNLRSAGTVTSTVAFVSPRYPWAVGGAIGLVFDAELSEIHSSSTVTSRVPETGGLIGAMVDSRLRSASATGNVSVDTAAEWCYVGGLLGSAFSWFEGGEALIVEDASATGDVSCAGGRDTGGLIGYAYHTDISDAQASGQVTATGALASYVGGLAGSVYNSTFTDISYEGNVAAEGDFVGGLIGVGYRTSSPPYARDVVITRALTSGQVEGHSNVGGIVGGGENEDASDPAGGVRVVSSRSSSNVSGFQSLGGIAGGGAGDFVLRDVASSGSIAGIAATDEAQPSTGHHGGLVGFLSATGSIERAYTTAMLTTDVDPSLGTVGSMIGVSEGTLIGLSFTSTDPNTLPIAGALADGSSSNAVYRSMSQLGQYSTYSSWNESSSVITDAWVPLSSRTTQVWGTCATVASGLPFLQWQRDAACPQAESDPAPASSGGAGAATVDSPTAVTPVSPTSTSQAGESARQPGALPTPASRPSGLAGVEVVTGLPADSVRVMRKPVGSTVATAPTVTAVAGQPVALAVRGLVPRSTVDVRFRSRGKSASLGSVVVAADGSATLPAFRARGASRITIALVDTASGSSSFVKVDVQQARSKPKARAGADRRAR